MSMGIYTMQYAKGQSSNRDRDRERERERERENEYADSRPTRKRLNSTRILKIRWGLIFYILNVVTLMLKRNM